MRRLTDWRISSAFKSTFKTGLFGVLAVDMICVDLAAYSYSWIGFDAQESLLVPHT
jgi:hypothetical protein